MAEYEKRKLLLVVAVGAVLVLLEVALVSRANNEEKVLKGVAKQHEDCIWGSFLIISYNIHSAVSRLGRDKLV